MTCAPPPPSAMVFFPARRWVPPHHCFSPSSSCLLQASTPIWLCGQRAKQEASTEEMVLLATMVETVGSFESRGPGFVGMSSTLEEVQMQETLAFSETIKVGSSFHQIRVPRCILLLHLVSFPFQLFQKTLLHIFACWPLKTRPHCFSIAGSQDTEVAAVLRGRVLWTCLHAGRQKAGVCVIRISLPPASRTRSSSKIASRMHLQLNFFHTFWLMLLRIYWWSGCLSA